MDHLDPAIELSSLNLFRPDEMQAAPLLSVSHLETRLDVLSSLRHLAPVFDRATATGVIVHLYQREDGSWGWLGPPRPPEALEPEGQVSLAQTEQGWRCWRVNECGSRMCVWCCMVATIPST